MKSWSLEQTMSLLYAGPSNVFLMLSFRIIVSLSISLKPRVSALCHAQSTNNQHFNPAPATLVIPSMSRNSLQQGQSQRAFPKTTPPYRKLLRAFSVLFIPVKSHVSLETYFLCMKDQPVKALIKPVLCSVR